MPVHYGAGACQICGKHDATLEVPPPDHMPSGTPSSLMCDPCWFLIQRAQREEEAISQTAYLIVDPNYVDEFDWLHRN